MSYFDTHIKTPLVVEQNHFLKMIPEEKELPLFEEVKDRLPQPFWEGKASTINCYWKAWELAFSNLRKPTASNGFIANFIDTAFDNHLFMWDSAFILLFAKYGQHTFNFLRTLDNLYVKQHLDGFICREIDEETGNDVFERFDPTSTGPNVLPWTEWEYYLLFGDKERLKLVFPVLLAYHRWLRSHRTWPDGSYFASGFASGMDNQPRQPKGYHTHFSHGHMAWIDMCCQQALSAKLLINISEIIGRETEIEDLKEEEGYLKQYVKTFMWDEKTGFYYDRWYNGELSGVKTIGSYWALIADLVDEDRSKIFVSHLEDENTFNRLHRVPSLAKEHPKYDSEGDYWVGSVWAPTNYMILRGLTKTDNHRLAHEIAMNHLDNVVQVFEETGTFWENYAPERVAKGSASKKDFVGWSGLPPIAVLFEYVFGIRPDVSNKAIVWDVRLLEEHGIYEYPFGTGGVINLKCHARTSVSETPVIEVKSNTPVTLEIYWNDGKETLKLNVLP